MVSNVPPRTPVPEARETHLATNLAQTQADGARSAMLPQVSFRGAFEADRQRFYRSRRSQLARRRFAPLEPVQWIGR